MRTAIPIGSAGRLIDKIGTAMHVIGRILERIMALAKRSDSLASYRSKLAHGKTYKMDQELADALLRKLRQDKKRRAEKKQREHEHA
ncbi:hypothetical protein ACVMIH_006877 [Bradyrhizobium sp. USDA 4503]